MTRSLQAETIFVCLASNRKGSIERSVTVTSEHNCQEEQQEQEELQVEEEEEEEELTTSAEKHTVTVQGGVNLNCSLPPGPVLVQWEAVRAGGARLYMTSWLAGLDQEYSRGCGDNYGIDTRGLGHLGCKVRTEDRLISQL